jgi:hypothetical protein
MRRVPRAAILLSAVSLTCAAAASVVTLAWDGVFPAPAEGGAFNQALAEARGWSAITLAVGVPLILVSLRAAAHGSLRGRLGWLGGLAYLVYTYLELAVSPPFTPLYLVYVGAFALALPALVMGVGSIDFARLGATSPGLRIVVAVFGLLVGLGLALAWLRGIVARTTSGEFGWPQGDQAIAHVVHALDLGLQVPLGIATGVLLLGRRPAGIVVGAIFLVNAGCMAAALTAMVATAARVAGHSTTVAIPFGVLTVVAVGLATTLFRRLQPGV